jgi:hypothetical protein
MSDQRTVTPKSSDIETADMRTKPTLCVWVIVGMGLAANRVENAHRRIAASDPRNAAMESKCSVIAAVTERRVARKATDQNGAA